MFRPQRPPDIISRDGRWKIIPAFTVIHVIPLDPKSVQQEQEAKTKGLLHRIIYCRRTYDFAMQEAERLVKNGLAADRIEYIFAEKDELAAIRAGHFDVVPLSD